MKERVWGVDRGREFEPKEEMGSEGEGERGRREGGVTKLDFAKGIVITSLHQKQGH